MFKVRLKTSRVSATASAVAGDVISVENDEAWSLIDQDLAELVGKKSPAKPARIVAEEKAAIEAAEKQAAFKLSPVHAEGELVAEHRAKSRRVEEKLKGKIAQLEEKLAEANALSASQADELANCQAVIDDQAKEIESLTAELNAAVAVAPKGES